MEAAQYEQITGCKDSITQIIKRKRSKRQRAPSPLTLDLLGMAHSSSSSSGGRTSDGYDSGTGYEHATTSSLATSDEFSGTTELEEDMANCLILLARGQRSTQQRNRKFSQIPADTAAISTAVTNMKKDAAAAIYTYQCKTCNKCFPSFQALGGHRTSHNKLKTMTKDQEKQLAGSALLIDQENDVCRDSTTITNLPLRMSNGALFSSANRNKQKLHECSLCGAVFSSGQALGGHMRRHRSFANNTCTTSMRVGTSGSECSESSKDRNTLKLDLNLPAPEDDHRVTEFSFQAKEKVLLLSATPLVDCPL